MNPRLAVFIAFLVGVLTLAALWSQGTPTPQKTVTEQSYEGLQGKSWPMERM